eukprot:6213220-Pleurochrysis_carterae.AAC.4
MDGEEEKKVGGRNKEPERDEGKQGRASKHATQSDCDGDTESQTARRIDRQSCRSRSKQEWTIYKKQGASVRCLHAHTMILRQRAPVCVWPCIAHARLRVIISCTRAPRNRWSTSIGVPRGSTTPSIGSTWTHRRRPRCPTPRSARAARRRIA